MVSIYFAAIYPLPGGHASFLRGKREARERGRERKEKVEVAVEKQRKWGKTLIKREKVASLYVIARVEYRWSVYIRIKGLIEKTKFRRKVSRKVIAVVIGRGGVEGRKT